MLNSKDGGNSNTGSGNNKKFMYTKDNFRPKVLGNSKPSNLFKSELSSAKKKESEEIQIKERSPLMYNRHKLPSKNNVKPEEKIKIDIDESKSLLKSVSPLNEKNLMDKLREQEDLENKKKLREAEIKNEKLENELRLLKMKFTDQEKNISDKSKKIEELEDENLLLRQENFRIKDKYQKLKLKIRQRMSQQQEVGEDLYLPNSNTNYSHIGRLSEMITNIRDIMFAQQEDEYISQMYPDPDNMTYEQLLELQEKIGYVSKGLTDTEIKKIPMISFSKLNSRKKNFSDTCTVCQTEFSEGEKIKQLNCQHSYHISCVDEWLKENKVCPICKEDVRF